MTEPEPTDTGVDRDAEAGEVEAESEEDAPVGEGGAPEGDDQEAEVGADGDAEEAVDTDAEEQIDEELIERVGATDPTTLAREIATLELEIEGLNAELEAREEEIEELTSKLKRKQADFENYKKRMQRRQEEERKRATEGLLERFLSVRDNLQRAVEQDEGVDVRDGVESTLRQFDDVLDTEGVAPIEPEPGAEVDPHRHEVLARVEADVPEGTVADVHRPGYEMGESVLREAQVTVSEGSPDLGDEDGADASSDSGEDSDEAEPAA